MNSIVITDKRLVVDEILELVSDGGAGAVNVFVGTVRNKTKGKTVIRLEFESYISMAIKEIEKIIEKASQKWPIIHIAIHHRVGVLGIGEIPIVIAVSTPHRKAGFEACEYCIDTLKETVPIWKREFFEDGDVWVSATP